VSVAAALVLRPGDESRLSSLVRSSTVEAGLAQRARIVLLAAQGVPNAEIARRVGVSRPTVIQWRNRYEAGGISALGDLDRSGRPPVIDDVAVVVATVQAPPEALGVTHWSARLLGKHLGYFVRVGGPDLAGMESAAVAARDVQVLHRPRVGRQDS
jgi:DNA-binding CsgD family transcriptional regulator